MYKTLNTYTQAQDLNIAVVMREEVLGKMLDGSSSVTQNDRSSKAKQSFMADKCSKDWDSYCEFASNDQTFGYPNMVGLNNNFSSLTSGEILIENSARKKYLKSLGNLVPVTELFNPNIPSQGIYTYYISKSHIDGNGPFGTHTTATYSLDGYSKEDIDKDDILNKILKDPIKYNDFLKNVYNTMNKNNTLKNIKGTKIYNYLILSFHNNL